MSWCKQCNTCVDVDHEWEYDDDDNKVYYDVCDQCGCRIEQ